MSRCYSVKLIIFFFMLLMRCNLFSNCLESPFCFYNLTQDWSAEFRVAYFSPESKRVRKIYSSNLIDYQVEISKNLCPNWSIWLDVDYLSKNGRSEPLHDSTRIWLIPIALGVNYQFWCRNGWNAYVGAGGNYTCLRMHDHSEYVKEHISKWNFGGTFKLGIKKVFCNGITLNFFCDYFLQKFHFSDKSRSSDSHYSSCYIERNSLNVSGLKVGMGIGYYF